MLTYYQLDLQEQTSVKFENIWIFVQQNAFENVCEMFRPQFGLSDAPIQLFPFPPLIYLYPHFCVAPEQLFLFPPSDIASYFIVWVDLTVHNANF